MTSEAETKVARSEPPAKPTGMEQVALLVNAIGTFLVVALALTALTVLCLALIGEVDPSDRAAVLTAAFTVVGTVVGGVTGARIGSKGREDAERARDIEAAKVQELAARVQAPDWEAAMDRLPERLADWGVGGSRWEGGGEGRAGW